MCVCVCACACARVSVCVLSEIFRTNFVPDFAQFLFFSFCSVFLIIFCKIKNFFVLVRNFHNEGMATVRSM
jgi:hypothetical protein